MKSDSFAKAYFNENEDDRGVLEYVLILVQVAVAVIAVLSVLGPTLASVYTQITYALEVPMTVDKAEQYHGGHSHPSPIFTGCMTVIGFHCF